MILAIRSVRQSIDPQSVGKGKSSAAEAPTEGCERHTESQRMAEKGRVICSARWRAFRKACRQVVAVKTKPKAQA